MNRTLSILLLFALLALIPFSEEVWDLRAEARRSAEAGYVMPAKFSRILAIEFQGLLSDYQLLRTITFYGERAMYGQQMVDADWDYVIRGLDVVTELDPYFLDPYVLAEGLLTWETGKIEEANRLLEKGRKSRDWDWQIPFFLGFNHFYFLQDFAQGAEYLMEASRLPGSPSFHPRHAARLGYFGNKAKTAIMFLEGNLAQSTDSRLRETLKLRLTAHKGAAIIEDALLAYQKRYQSSPDQLVDLVTKGYLPSLPEEPYGGKWVLLKNGRIFSTSRFVSDTGEGKK
jgi:hypothetical protein